MIPTLLALAAAAAPAQAASDEALRSCAARIKGDPQQGLAAAQRWAAQGGGVAARACLGLGYASLERWSEAAAAFEQAAAEAQARQDQSRAHLLVQAGNAWLAAGEAAKARASIDAALEATLLAPALRGQAYLDRARAGVALGDLFGARIDMDKGLQLVPGDPVAWYLSAALARRQGDMARAQLDIAKALQGAPEDPEVLLEAGNIAGLAGDLAAARALFARAAQAAPDSDAGRRAREALAANPGAPSQ